MIHENASSSGAPPLTTPRLVAPDQRAILREKAEELETLFLAEMLGYSGLDASEGPFSGGIGEEQFASFLREEQARAMVKAGGIGLAEQLFQSMIEDAHG